jgi:hypothetical protein
MIVALAFGTVWLFVAIILSVTIVSHANDRRRDELFIFELRRRSRMLAERYHFRGR